MGYVLKLKRGSKVLDLSSGVYTLDQWIPPRANIISNIASGTSANRYGGGQKVSERAVNTSTVFSVRIQGSSNAECEEWARQIEHFLRGAGDESEPTYLEWRSDENIEIEPIWGQTGINTRYEVVSGSVDRWNSYFVAAIRNTTMFVNVLLELKPFALGKRQQLCKASGGIILNGMGSPTGRGKGTIIPEATTNKFTNPVFGHATWNNDWTAGAHVAEEVNTDENYVLFGSTSARVTLTGPTTVTFTQTLNAGNTNPHALSCYVKRLSGGVITNSDIRLYYGAGVDPNIIDVGNGWYRLLATVTGVAAGVDTGVAIWSLGGTYFVDGFQFEEKAYPTPFCFGDLLGCSWSSTAHASTSVRTAAKCVVSSDYLNTGQGTIRVAWKSDTHSTSRTSTPWLFHDGSFGAYYATATTDWRFTDGSNTIDSGAASYDWGTEMIFHFVWNAASLKIYLNGAEIATGSSYSPIVYSDLFIGSSSATANHINGTFKGFTIYDHALTATEVLNDYNNLAELLYEEIVVDYIPWLWTKDGDNVVDQYNDATHDNFCVLGGVPGNVPAITDITMTASDELEITSESGGLLLSLLDVGLSDNLSTTDLFSDVSGDVDADVVGGESYQPTITLNSVGISNVVSADISPSANTMKILRGREAVLLYRMSDAGATLQTQLDYSILTGSSSLSDWSNYPYSSSAVYRNGITSSITIDMLKGFYDDLYVFNVFGLYVRRTVSGAATVKLDYMQLLPRPFLRIYSSFTTSSLYAFRYKSDAGVYGYNTSGVITNQVLKSGDDIEFLPNKYNYLFSIVGDIKTSTVAQTAITTTLTYSSVYITPRWSLG